MNLLRRLTDKRKAKPQPLSPNSSNAITGNAKEVSHGPKRHHASNPIMEDHHHHPASHLSSFPEGVPSHDIIYTRAAIHIQAGWRGYLGRKRVHRLKSTLEEEEDLEEYKELQRALVTEEVDEEDARDEDDAADIGAAELIWRLRLQRQMWQALQVLHGTLRVTVLEYHQRGEVCEMELMGWQALQRQWLDCRQNVARLWLCAQWQMMTAVLAIHPPMLTSRSYLYDEEARERRWLMKILTVNTMETIHRNTIVSHAMADRAAMVELQTSSHVVALEAQFTRQRLECWCHLMNVHQQLCATEDLQWLELLGRWKTELTFIVYQTLYLPQLGIFVQEMNSRQKLQVTREAVVALWSLEEEELAERCFIHVQCNCQEGMWCHTSPVPVTEGQPQEHTVASLDTNGIPLYGSPCRPHLLRRASRPPSASISPSDRESLIHSDAEGGSPSTVNKESPPYSPLSPHFTHHSTRQLPAKSKDIPQSPPRGSQRTPATSYPHLDQPNIPRKTLPEVHKSVLAKEFPLCDDEAMQEMYPSWSTTSVTTVHGKKQKRFSLAAAANVRLAIFAMGTHDLEGPGAESADDDEMSHNEAVEAGTSSSSIGSPSLPPGMSFKGRCASPAPGIPLDVEPVTGGSFRMLYRNSGQKLTNISRDQFDQRSCASAEVYETDDLESVTGIDMGTSSRWTSPSDESTCSPLMTRQAGWVSSSRSSMRSSPPSLVFKGSTAPSSELPMDIAPGDPCDSVKRPHSSLKAMQWAFTSKGKLH